MSAKNLFRKLMTKAFRPTAPAALRKAAPRRTKLALEQIEERITPATYDWDPGTAGSSTDGTLTIYLGTNQSVTISESGGTRSFTLSSGNFNVGTGSTATGNGSPTIMFAAGDDINSSTAVFNLAAAAGSTNNVRFNGGHYGILNFNVQMTGTGTTGGVTFAAGVSQFDGVLNLETRGADITQTGGSIDGATYGAIFELEAPNQNIVLTHPANNFDTTLFSVIVDKTPANAPTLSASFTDVNDFTLDNATLAGDLTITAGGAVGFRGSATVGGDLVVSTTAGGIANLAAGLSQLRITGTSSLNGGGGDITLNRNSNNFGGVVSATNATNITLHDTNAITLGTVTASGTATVNTAGAVDLTDVVTAASLSIDTNGNGAGGGTITDSGAGRVAVTGTTTLDGVNFAITLDNAANDFGAAVVATAGSAAVTLTDANGLSAVSITTTSGAVSLTAVTGSITDADGATDVQGGAVTITAPGGIGAAGAPLALRATSVTTSSTNTNQFLTEFDTVNVVAGDLNAGVGTVSLLGGTFVETTGGVADASTVDVNGATLNVAAVNDTVALLRLTAGTVTGTTGVLTSVANVDAQGGTIGAILGGTAGLAKTTAATVTLSRANTYTGVTTVTGGPLLLTGSVADGPAANDVVVNSGGTLGGTGSTNGGGVLVNSNGHLAPGNSPGILNTGSITLTAGAFYDVELVAPYNTAGTGYDQTNVTGIVTLGGATLNPTGGTVAGTPGQQLVLVNNDGTDAVIGTFAGLPDGAMVSSGSFTAFLSYFGGDGNDVTLTVGGANPVITGGAAADSFELRRVNATIQVLQNGTVVYAAPAGAVSTLQINGAGGNDNLFVNFAGGNPVPSGGVTFNGNAESGPPGDSITTSGGSFNTVVYTFTNLTDGSIAFDPDGSGGMAPAVVAYTGLEPITDNNDATNRQFDYTAAVSETVTLQDDGNLGNNMSQVTSTQGEVVTFTNPTATLTINAAAGAGAAVADTIVVTALDTGLSGRTITINAGSAGDSVSLSNGSNFAAATPINVNTGGGDDVVNVSVNGTNSNLTINTGAGAADMVNVGFTAPGQTFGQGNLEGIAGTVAVTDAGDGLTLQVDDFGDNDVDGAVTFTASAITGAADAGGSISYLNVTTLNYNLPNVAGAPGDQVNVQSSAAGTTANVFGNLGDDVFVVGNASVVTGILGVVAINGGGGADTVNYNSQNDPSGTYTVTGTTVQRTGTAAVTYAAIETLNVNTSNAPGAGDTVNVTGTAAGVATTVNANDGTDTVTVTNTTGPLTVNGGPALDTIVVGSADTTTTGLGAGNLTNVAGAVVVNGDAGGADLIVDGSASGLAANYQITSTTVTRSTPAGFGGVTYGTLTTLRLKTGTGANVIDVPSTAVPTAILTSAGADTIDVGGTTAQTLANIAAPVTIDGGTGAGSTTDTDTVNVNDQNSAGSFTYTVGTATVLRGATVIVADYNVGGRTENLNVNGSTAGNNTYTVNGTSATVSNTVNDGTAAASGNGTFNIQANAVQAGAANTFNGFNGTDTFNVNFAAGASVPNAPGTTFVVNGGAPAGTAARDVVNVNTTAAGDGVRTVGITYAATPGDADVTGLGALLDLNGVETLVYTGDGANNDALTVTGTAGNDDITVAPQTLNSALVFLGGNPFDGPPEVSTQLVGLAGGGAGPDMHLRGLATSTGLTIDGGAGTANHLYVYGRSEASLIDPAAAGAGLNIFGFGAGVLIPGTGVGLAYDNMVVSDAAVRFTTAPNPTAADVRLTTNVVTASFLQAAPNLTGLTVNPGDEAAPGFGGVADSVFATLSFNFRIQVNGGDPLPANAPNGDELNVVAPAEINIWSDQLNPPTVTFNSAGSQQLGFTSIERLTLTPGNGVVNVLGDNNNPATPQADTFIIQGDGANRFDLSINGSAPIQFLGTTTLNVLGGLLDDTTAVTPFATAIQEWNIATTVDGQATGATGDRLIYTDVAGLFDDTHVQATGPGAGRINAHGIGAHTTDQVVRFLGTEQVTVLANAGDADALTLGLTPAADAVTFVFDPATAPVTPPINTGVGLPGQPVAQVGNDILLTNLFNLVIDANNAALVVNGDAGADTFLVNLNGAGAAALPLALTINAGAGTDTITLQGNAGGDTFNNVPGVDAQAGVTSLGGTDTADVNYTGVEALAYNGGADGADVVNLTGTPGTDTVTVTETAGAPAGTATIDGQPAITFTGIGTNGLNPVRVATFGGDDQITFNQAVNWGVAQVSVDAGPPTGSDTFQVNGTAAADTFTFNPTTRVVTVTPTGGTTVTYTPTNVEVFVLDGGDPTTPPGDLLTVATGMTGTATPPSGTLTASGLVLNYQNFERVVVDAAPTQVDDANAAAGNGAALPRAIEDAAVILDVLANDTFAASIGIGGATIQLATLPTNGTVQILAATDPANPTSITPATAHQVIRYTPAANFFGTDTFTYRPVDRNGQVSAAAATVTVTVNPVNDEPSFTLTNTPVVVAEDAGAVAVQVATGVSVGPANEAAAGQTAAFVVTTTNPALFAVAPAISPTGLLTFTPAPNQNGTATLTVFLRDTGGTSDGGDDTSATVQFTITVTPVNDAPTLSAAADVTTNEDTAVAVPGIVVSDVDATVPTATDFDVTVTLALTQPAIGTLAVQPANGVTVSGNGTANVSVSGPRTLVNGVLGSLLYTPNANRNGTDTITVTVDDRGNIGGGNLTATDTILVTVTPVNDAPVANPDAATTAEDTPVTIDVRANDTDVETASNALTVAIATAPPAAQGTVQVVANQIVFTPALNFNGTATFTYTVTDGGDGASSPLTSAAALVTVTVTAVNDAPVNGVPGAQTTAEDTPLVFTGPNALTVGDPADGNQGDMTATVTVTNGRFTLSTVAGLAVTGNGTTTVTLTGTVAAINAALNGASYTPTANYNGPALLTLTTSDNGNVGAGPAVGLTDSDTVAITVTAVNDVPTVTGTSATTAEDTAVDIDLKPFVTDVETAAGAMTYNLGGATNGAVAYLGNGVVRFTPAANYSGPASFTYSVTDAGDGAAPPATSNTATVTVTVTPVADAPTLAVTSPVAGNEGAAIPLTINAALTDPSETLTVSITGFPAGTVFSAGVNNGTTLELTAAQVAGLTARFPDNGVFNLQVTATSTESDGSTATTPTAPAVNLVVTVNNVNPTATLGNGGPVNENSAGTVSFTNQGDQAQADVVAGLRYSYDFDNDGTFEIGNGTYVGSVTTASATVPASHLADGPSTRTVRARIVDKDGGFTDYTTAITVNNVAPTATFGVSGPLVPGQPATVSFSNQADVSPADVAAGFTYQYDLGTGVFGPATTSPTATFTPPGPGVYTLRGRIIDKDGGTTEYTATAGVGASAGQVVVANVDTYAVGAGPGGGPVVQVYRASDNALLTTIVAYEPGFRGGVNAAMADVTGDGIPDLITGTGVGGGPVVKVFDGVTYAQVASFYAYEPSFRGGVTVAAGDITGTGVASIVTGSGFGGGPVVKVFTGTGTLVRSFLAYGETQRGGVNVGVGQLSPTGPASIITGAGRGGAPHVKTFTAAGAQQLSFFAYDASFTGGVYVSGGRLYGPGNGSIVTGTGLGGGPVLRIFDGVTGAQQVSVPAFGPDAYGRSLREGFTVNATHVGGATGEPRIVVGAGPDFGPTVRVLDAATLAQEAEFLPFELDFTGGVYVG